MCPNGDSELFIFSMLSGVDASSQVSLLLISRGTTRAECVTLPPDSFWPGMRPAFWGARGRLADAQDGLEPINWMSPANMSRSKDRKNTIKMRPPLMFMVLKIHVLLDRGSNCPILRITASPNQEMRHACEQQARYIRKLTWLPHRLPLKQSSRARTDKISSIFISETL